MKNKYKVLDLVKHIIDKENLPMIVMGVVERPKGYTYLCTYPNDTEKEYFEEEILKY